MIVVTGEALIDLIPSANGELSVNVGGGPLNAARWLGRLGQPVAYLGAVSEDLLGTQIRDSLLECDVSLATVVSTPLPTTLALVQLDAARVPQFSFYHEGTSMPSLTAEQVLSVLPDQLQAVLVGGLGLMLEPAADASEAMVAHARATGALVSFDPNIRPSLLGEREHYLARFGRVLAQTDVLKVSVEDLAWLEPGKDPVVAARGLRERGPAVVLVTAGGEGATVVGADSELTVPAQHVEVLDTVGAGDAFSAGFITRWLEQRLDRAALADSEPVLNATRFAMAVAALACTTQGATPPRSIASLELS